MATIREQVIDLHGRGYTPTEIYNELLSHGVKVTKTLIHTVLSMKSSESNHFRRAELSYEMLCEISAKLDYLIGMRPGNLRRAIERMEMTHASKEIKPLPPEHPTGSGG
jgi:hypothetical protein